MSDIFASRREKLRKLVKKQNAEAILITNFTNVTWLTGFTGDDSWLLVHQEGACLLSDSRYTIQIEQECPGLKLRLRSSQVGFPTLIQEELQQACGKDARLGFEGTSITFAEAERLRAKVTERIVPLYGLPETLRQIKDRTEIQITRDSARIAGRAFQAIRAMIRPDWTEKQTADELEFAMRRLGAKDASFPTIAAVGSNAALPHCVPGDRRVGEAPFILIDWGAKYRGYASDLTRVLITGKVSQEFRKVYQIVRDAQQKAIDAIRPGVPCSEIDAEARNYIAKAGYGDCFGHGLGHGIGLNIHEGPSFHASCQTILKPGMIITVEPGIYVKGWGGVRIEDDVLVTRNGCEVITDVERELDQMYVV